MSDEFRQSIATNEHVATVVTREVQGLRVRMTQRLQSLSDKLTMPGPDGSNRRYWRRDGWRCAMGEVISEAGLRRKTVPEEQPLAAT